MAGNNIRFTTAMDDGRPTKDPSVTDEGQPGLSGGFYDNSVAKLANKTEDHRLTLAIEGISLEQYRSVADLEDDKKKVKRGFQSLLSQRQLLDVARADRIVGPGRSSTGDRETENHILMRRYRPQGSQHLLSSTPRQLFQPNPSMPHPSSKKRDTNKQTIDHNGNHGNQPTTQTPYSVHRRPHTGFHAVRPFTSGGRRRTGTPQSPRGKNPHGAESVREGGGDIDMSPSEKTTTRAKTATGVRQNQIKLDQSCQNQGQNSEGQPKPVQTTTNRNSVDTDTDDDTVKGASRPRSKSAFGIDQISITTYPIEEDMHFFTGPSLTSRRYSGSMQGRPQTASAAVLHGRSRRELSRLTHIDAITASEMALRRKMWLARQDNKNTVGEAALQQRIQEFITKLDTDKRKREEQHLMMFENEDKREDLVLPAV